MDIRVSSPDNPRRLALEPFAHTFVPFGLLLSAALLAGEAALDASLARLNYSVWASLALFIPALALFAWPGGDAARERYRRLLWTFSFLAYLVHFYYAVFVHYHGSMGEVFRSQGPLIAGSNSLATAWWGFDVVLTWGTAARPRWLRAQRAILHGFLVIAFFMASVVIFRGFVNVLGVAMAATVVACLIARLAARPRSVAPVRAAPSLPKAKTA